MRAIRALVCLSGLGVSGLAHAATVSARVVAIDQPYDYNRFGAFNPVGMMYALEHDVVDVDTGVSCAEAPCTPGLVMLRPDKRPRPLVLRVNEGDRLEVTFTNLLDPSQPPDGPLTRTASIHVNGLQVDGANGTETVAPGATATYAWEADDAGTFLFFSHGAVAGGEGNGGSLVLGLFGAVNVEPRSSVWYRGQVTAEDLAYATRADGSIDYAAVYPAGHPYAGRPILAMVQGGEIVHGDLNALITNVAEPTDWLENTTEGDYREFTIVFHDELKTVQAYERLETDESFHGVRDAFGINYGASGMGAALLANRLGEGPAADCAECKFEEFFLSSWANGDPALLPAFEDDPSNVFHSYLNEPVKIRNLHAGPKETHVFHLHAHQWTATDDADGSVYRDSQSVAPGGTVSYEINYGGSGNRNKTPGDAILHCHLYPHFASGMWGLWRIHDVFEDGTRTLPDGELGPGTSPYTGLTDGGTPIPAVVPLPELPLPPAPTYMDAEAQLAAPVNPGFPFYIPGLPGRRPPQPPLDLAEDGGLPRHVVLGGVVGASTLGEFHRPLVSVDLRLLPDEGTPLEQEAMAFHALPYHETRRPTEPADDTTTDDRFVTNGLPPAPGAPFADPCPTDAPVREYHVSAIQLDGVLNRFGWHDPQLRMLALDADVEEFLDGSKPPEPLFFRALSGECIVFNLTNRLPDALAPDDFQVYTPTDTVGQHIHLVKFDVTASDGSGNGWNYEDGALAIDAVAELIHAANATGGAVVDVDGQPVGTLAPDGTYQTNVQRWWADPLLDGNGADRTLRTVFTHDHFAPSSQQQHGYYAGLIIEPAGSEWQKPDGSPLTGGVGTAANIVGADDPLTHPDAREFGVAVADFAIAYDSRGNPVNPPHAPEVISAADPGTMLVNYRNEPLPLRFAHQGEKSGLRTGDAGDPAFVFSSAVHGDPSTTVFRAFEGDPVRFALIQGAQEEQHVFTVQGQRWLREPGVPATRYTATQAIGISEHFELELGPVGDVTTRDGVIDRLYGTTTLDDLWNGVWGILRVFSAERAVDPGTRTRVALARLPGRPGPFSVRNAKQFNGPCPVTATVRRYDVEAWEAEALLGADGLVYNTTYDLHDPSGLVFVDAADLVGGAWPSTKPFEPLVLRAAAGDCVEVRLTNRLTAPVADLAGDARMPPIASLGIDDVAVSASVGITPQLVEVLGGDAGINAGFNQRSTARPGESVTYRWYAGRLGFVVVGTSGSTTTVDRVATPVEYGTINLTSFGDVLQHGPQGMIGTLVIEPAGSTWRGPDGIDPSPGSVADIYGSSGQHLFRELVLQYQDGLNLLRDGASIDDGPFGEDPEDAGERAFNYRTEPLWARLGISPDAELNDQVLGDDLFCPADPAALSPAVCPGPSCPTQATVLHAPLGLQVVLRVGQASGRARQHQFALYDHEWVRVGSADGGCLVGSQGPLSVGIASDIWPAYGAGAFYGSTEGVSLFRDMPTNSLATGLWGCFVATEGPTPVIVATPAPSGGGSGGGGGKGKDK